MREYQIIATKSYYDPCVNATVEMMTYITTQNEIGFAVILPNAGICRSRSAFASAVEAAADSMWNETYHSLYGEEAVPFIPASLIEAQAVSNEAERSDRR